MSLSASQSLTYLPKATVFLVNDYYFRFFFYFFICTFDINHVRYNHVYIRNEERIPSGSNAINIVHNLLSRGSSQEADTGVSTGGVPAVPGGQRAAAPRAILAHALVLRGAAADRARLAAALLPAAARALPPGNPAAVRRRAGGPRLGGGGRDAGGVARRGGGAAGADGRLARRLRALRGRRGRRAAGALRGVQQPRAGRRAADVAAPVLRAEPRRPGRGGGGRARAPPRRAAAGLRRVAGRPHPGPVPGGARRGGRAGGGAGGVVAAGRGARRRLHGARAAQRAAVVAHGAQPAGHGARARGPAPRALGARAAGGPLRAPVRRRLHHRALRLRLRGRLLPRRHAPGQAAARAGAAAVPLRRRRPLPAARRDTGAGGGGLRGRRGGAGGDGPRRPHRVPGGLVAGAARAHAVHDATRPPVLRRDPAAK